MAPIVVASVSVQEDSVHSNYTCIVHNSAPRFELHIENNTVILDEPINYEYADTFW